VRDAAADVDAGSYARGGDRKSKVPRGPLDPPTAAWFLDARGEELNATVRTLKFLAGTPKAPSARNRGVRMTPAGARDSLAAKGRAPMAVFPVWLYDDATGLLAVNVFGRRHNHLRARQRREIDEIIAGLSADLAAGNLAPGSVKVGWPGVGLPPVDAVDIHGPEMSAWLSRAYVIRLRVDDATGERMAVDDRNEPA
jgi:hypothetical protein